MWKLMLYVLLFLVYATESNAAYFKSIVQVEKATERAMLSIKNSNIVKAFEDLREYWPISDDDFEIGSIQALQSITALQEKYGQPVDVVQISNSNVADTFVRINYFVKYKKHAIQWEFYYYNGVNGWILNTVDTHDNIKKLFSSDSSFD